MAEDARKPWDQTHGREHQNFGVWSPGNGKSVRCTKPWREMSHAVKQWCLGLESLFFWARSCLGKVPGRAPFSQLSKRATACTIRMQIVKQINENELDIRKRINQLGQLIQSKLKRKRCSETKGTHKLKVEGRTGANSTDTAEVLLGYTCNEVALAKVQLARSRSIECILVTRWPREGWRGKRKRRSGSGSWLEPKICGWWWLWHPSETFGVPGSGERMRNLTTTGLGEKKCNNGGRLRVLSESTQMFLSRWKHSSKM